MMDPGIVLIVVDAINDVERTFGGGSDDNFFNSLVEIRLQRLGFLMVHSGRFNDDIASRPIGLAQRLAATITDGLPIDEQSVSSSCALMGPDPVDRVELQQVSRARGVTGDLVDLHEFEILPTPRGAQAQSAHAAEAINPDSSAHYFSPHRSVQNAPLST